MDNQRLEINILPAYHGDCIHLRFYSLDNELEQTEEQESAATPKSPAYKWYNIVIDSGPAKHKYGFTGLMHSIRDRGEKVDLLCFSHVDDDHILAAERFFGNPEAAENAAEYVKEIWINIPKYEVDRTKSQKPSHTEQLSPNSTSDLYGYILWHKIPCETWIVAGKSTEYGEVKIQVMLPTPMRLDEYEAWWEAKRPTEQMSSDSDDPVDPSKSNGSSIALLVEAYGSKMLFTGDAYADDLEKVAQEQAGSGFDLVKLPHHGSKANASKAMLEAMKCGHLVISSNGKQKKLKDKRPALETIRLIHKHGMEKGYVTVYGNHDWDYVKTCVNEENLVGVNIIKLEEKAIRIADRIEIRTESKE